MSKKKTLDITTPAVEEATAAPAQASAEEVLTRDLSPALDVYEGENALLIQTDMPGVSKEGIRLQLEERILTLEGTWRREVKGQPLDDALTDLRWTRSVQVPKGVDTEGITARLEDGLLSVTLPWAKAPEPRQIAVN